MAAAKYKQLATRSKEGRAPDTDTVPLLPDGCCSGTGTPCSTRIPHTGPVPYFSEEDWNSFTQAQRKALRRVFYLKQEHLSLKVSVPSWQRNILKYPWVLIHFNCYGSTHQLWNSLYYLGLWAIIIIFMVFLKTHNVTAKTSRGSFSHSEQKAYN